MTRSSVLSAAVAATFPCFVHAAELRSFGLANWSGGSYSDDTTRQFSHCVLQASYQDRTSLLVAVYRNWSWTLGFANPSWQLQSGTQIPVEVSFDGRPPYSGNATVLNPNLAALPMAPTSQLIRDFRASRGMFVLAGGKAHPFNLDATSRVLVAVAQCVHAELAYEQGGPVPDLAAAAMFTGTTRALNPSNLATTQAVSSPPAPPPAALGDLTLVATQIASNLLLNAGLPNARILSAAETPEGVKGFGVAWTSDAGVGAVRIINASAGETGQDVASQLISSDASTCKGDFASGRSSELVDNAVVTKAFIGCKQSDGMRAARYLIYQGGPSHFVVFDTLQTASTTVPSVPPASESRVETAALRAVSYETWK